jgi:hypothetical protein
MDPITNQPVRKLWMDEITENPPLGAVETWEIYNYTVDAHPMHIHEVQMQLISREPFDPATGQLLGGAVGPNPEEAGFKDTFLALPGEVTRLKAKFDLPGRYVWHCHIVEHEDNEMMRPYDVVKEAGFPRTPLIDNFNRANGPINSGWAGANKIDQYRIVNQAVDVRLGGPVFWNSAAFGANQEAYFTFTQVSAASKEQDLILKYTASNKMIEIRFDAPAKAIRVETVDPAQGWVERAVFSNITFAPGDQLGARALFDGQVVVFKNGVAIGSTNVISGPKPWPAPLAKGGGKVGFWFIGNFTAPNQAGFENFGGGTM